MMGLSSKRLGLALYAPKIEKSFKAILGWAARSIKSVEKEGRPKNDVGS